MLLNLTQVQILWHVAPCDMRKSIDGLSQLIASEMGENPSDGRLYIFANKNRDKLKILYWEKNGFCLWYKRLERSKFKLPAVSEAKLCLTAEQLQWLLSGLDIKKLTGFTSLKYSCFY
jgi:transposase